MIKCPKCGSQARLSLGLKPTIIPYPEVYDENGIKTHRMDTVVIEEWRCLSCKIFYTTTNDDRSYEPVEKSRKKKQKSFLEYTIRRLNPVLYIYDAIEELRLTESEFSEKSGISEETLNSIARGTPLNEEMAVKLAKFFDTSVGFWLSLQKSHEEYIKRKMDI